MHLHRGVPGLAAILTLAATTRAYVTAIGQQCPGVLSGLEPLSGAIHKTALLDLVAEGVGDVDVAANTPGRGALAAFAHQTMALRWTSPRSANNVHHYFAAENALYQLPASDLCADAGAFAADDGQTAPPNTTQWFTKFAGSLRDANTADRAFQLQLKRLSGVGDLPVIVTNQQLEQRLQTHEQKLLQATATSLMSALGLPASVRVQFAHSADRPRS
jgi:hypothetical protein